MKILIAEDDATSRLLLRRVLESHGYEVTVTTDGAAAWEVLSGEGAPRLAILDWMMPEMDGVEVCRRARALDTMQPPYIILLTGRGDKESVVAGLDAGADDYLSKPYDAAELHARVEVGRRLIDLNDRLLEAQRVVELQARTDGLTGVLNRTAVFGELELEIERARREQAMLGIGMLDIDHFKRVNDTAGHAAGDAVLREVTRRGASVLRPYDTLGRFGGEEFVIIVPGVDREALSEAVERVRRVVASAPIVSGEHSFVITVSVGAAIWQGETADALIACADDALYLAKERGRDAVVIAEGS